MNKINKSDYIKSKQVHALNVLLNFVCEKQYRTTGCVVQIFDKSRPANIYLKNGNNCNTVKFIKN